MRTLKLLKIRNLSAICLGHIAINIPKLLYLGIICKAYRVGKRCDALVHNRIIGIDGIDRKSKLIACLDIAISRGRPIADLNGLAAVGKIEHCYRACAAVLVVCLIHTLRVDKHIGDYVARVTRPLSHYHVIGSLMTAHCKNDIGIS